MIVSYHFFDKSKVGGKRWYNFAKELSKNNNIDLITCDEIYENSFIDESFRIRTKYPPILDKYPISLIERFQYKTSLLFQKFISEGSYYDRGVNVLNILKKLVIELHRKNNYDIIITTAAPFSWANLIVDLKKNKLINDVLVFSDLRDPWTWGIGYGMKSLSKKRIAFENKQESNTILNSDKLFVPALKMKSFLEKKYRTSNIILLSHGFDNEKITKSLSQIENTKLNTINFIYAGTWYNGINDVFSNLIELFETFELDYHYKIFTESFFDNSIINKSSKVHIGGYLEECDMFQEIFKSNFYLLIFPSTYKDFLSAKLYEICFIGTPIIYIGESGQVSEFITKNQFGYHLTLSTLLGFLKKNHNLKTLRPNNYILDDYSFENLSKLITDDIYNNS